MKITLINYFTTTAFTVQKVGLKINFTYPWKCQRSPNTWRPNQMVALIFSIALSNLTGTIRLIESDWIEWGQIANITGQVLNSELRSSASPSFWKHIHRLQLLSYRVFPDAASFAKLMTSRPKNPMSHCILNFFSAFQFVCVVVTTLLSQVYKMWFLYVTSSKNRKRRLDIDRFKCKNLLKKARCSRSNGQNFRWSGNGQFFFDISSNLLTLFFRDS